MRATTSARVDADLRPLAPALLDPLAGGVDADLAAEGEVGGGVVEHVDRAVGQDQVAPHVDVGEGAPGRLADVLHVHVLVEDHQRLGLGHLAGAPQAVDHLLGLARVLLLDGDQAEVVEDPLHRHAVVDDLRGDHLQERQEEPLGRLAEPLVLDRRRPDHGGRVDGVLPVGDGHHVEGRVVVGQRVEAGVVAEGPLAHQRRRGVHEPLDDDVGVGRDLEAGGHALHHPDPLAAQEAGEEVLVDVGRQRRRGAVGEGRVAAQRDGHRHPLAAPLVLAVVGGGGLVELPVHGQLARAQDLQPVHPDVADAGLGIAGDDLRQGDERPAVVRPGGEHRQDAEVGLRALQDDLLAGAGRDQPSAPSTASLPRVGSSFSLSQRVLGGAVWRSARRASACSWKSSQESAQEVRRRVPKRFMATGNFPEEGFSKSSDRPALLGGAVGQGGHVELRGRPARGRG